MAFPRLICRRPDWRYPNPQHAPWCFNRACGYDLHWLTRPLALHAVSQGHAVAVVTTPADCPGVSVANFPEGVMQQLLLDYPGWTFTLIDHTPAFGPIGYSQWGGGSLWQCLSLEQVAAMTGERV